MRERFDFDTTPFASIGTRKPRSSELPSSSSQDTDENEFWLQRERSLIHNLLEEEGEMGREEIGDRLGCKYWGPMRFRAALKQRVERGAFRKSGHNRYAPVT